MPPDKRKAIEREIHEQMTNLTSIETNNCNINFLYAPTECRNEINQIAN